MSFQVKKYIFAALGRGSLLEKIRIIIIVIDVISCICKVWQKQMHELCLFPIKRGVNRGMQIPPIRHNLMTKSVDPL